MSRWGLVKLAGATAAVVCGLVGLPGLAHACTCVERDAGESLRGGTPALIAEVLDKQPVATYGDPLLNQQLDQYYTYTLRVERAFNADFGPQLTIRANSNGGACGFSWEPGQRVGAFVYRSGSEWRTSSCGLIDPAQLEAAANEPDPRLGGQVEPQPPGGDPGIAVLRARARGRVVDAGPRAGRRLERLTVRPGGKIRLRLARAARSVTFAPARPNGKRLGRPRAARASRHSHVAWLAKVPRSLPRRTDRLLVWIDYGDERVVLAVGLTIDCRPGRCRRSQGTTLSARRAALCGPWAGSTTVGMAWATSLTRSSA